MKKIINLCIIVIGIMALMANSCDKDTPISDCGCNSPVIGTVSDSTGILEYDTIIGTYVIQKNVGQQWTTSYYICSDIFKARNIYIKHGSEHINVNFSGQIKKRCPDSNNYFPESTLVMITLTQLNDITQ